MFTLKKEPAEERINDLSKDLYAADPWITPGVTDGPFL